MRRFQPLCNLTSSPELKQNVRLFNDMYASIKFQQIQTVNRLWGAFFLILFCCNVAGLVLNHINFSLVADNIFMLLPQEQKFLRNLLLLSISIAAQPF